MQASIETAEFLAKWGWLVVPLPYGPLRPSDVEDLIGRASDDPIIARSLFVDVPHADVGVPLGQRSGTFVLRVEGQAGVEALHVLTKEHGHLPNSIRSQPTPKTEHIWLQLPLGYALASQQLGEGLHVLGDGQIIHAPPLSGPGASGWTVHPRDNDLALPPAWLMSDVATLVLPSEPESAARVACRALHEAAMAQGGRREDALRRAAHAMTYIIGTGLMTRDGAFLELLGASEHNGLSREPRWEQLQPLLIAALSKEPAE